ncbi:MAG: hypothetical protein ACQCN6_00305 [Candidatus Bathyarchaeia archaeon]|jgi:hypothetical protein
MSPKSITITASYSGDSNYPACQITNIFAVYPFDSYSLLISPSNTTVQSGNAVHYTAQLTNSHGENFGTVGPLKTEDFFWLMALISAAT